MLLGGALGVAVALLLRPRPNSAGVDIVRLQNRVLELAGDASVEVRDLGHGIVELVGEVESPGLAETLTSALGEAPGVSSVLDRLWVRPPRLVS